MVNLHLDVLEFVSRSTSRKSVTELVDDFSSLVGRHGFPIFILTGLPSKDLDVEPLVLANHWPVEWSDRYREQMYFPDDPVSTWSRTKRAPFRWLEAQRSTRATQRTRQIAGEAWDVGLADGYAFPMHERRCGAVVSIAAEATIRHDIKTEASLALAAMYFRQAAERLVREPVSQPYLSEREREVLTWFAAGKSAWEISCILALSQSTVKSHCRSIREKLDAVNTTHAVAKAMSFGLIQL